jgi:hypothetical protein
MKAVGSIAGNPEVNFYTIPPYERYPSVQFANRANRAGKIPEDHDPLMSLAG